MKDYKFYKNDYLVFSDGRVYSFKSHYVQFGYEVSNGI